MLWVVLLLHKTTIQNEWKKNQDLKQSAKGIVGYVWNLSYSLCYPKGNTLINYLKEKVIHN